MSTMTSQSLDVLYSRQQIAERVAEMGAQITRDLNGEKLVMIGVLKALAFFLVDLSRAIDAGTFFDFVAVSSYGNGQRSSGAVKVIKDLDQPIEGTNVLIVEDILDTGLTIARICASSFLAQHPKSKRAATLLDKPSHQNRKNRGRLRRLLRTQSRIIGCGADYAERYRNLPDICQSSQRSSRDRGTPCQFALRAAFGCIYLLAPASAQPYTHFPETHRTRCG